MLAEIFMVRLEAAARLQEQTASLSSSSVRPVHSRAISSYSKTGRLILPTAIGRLEMGKSRKSDWPAVFSSPFARRGDPDRIHAIIGQSDSSRLCEKVAEPFPNSNTTPPNGNTS